MLCSNNLTNQNIYHHMPDLLSFCIFKDKTDLSVMHKHEGEVSRHRQLKQRVFEQIAVHSADDLPTLLEELLQVPEFLLIKC